MVPVCVSHCLAIAAYMYCACMAVTADNVVPTQGGRMTLLQNGSAHPLVPLHVNTFSSVSISAMLHTDPLNH